MLEFVDIPFIHNHVISKKGEVFRVNSETKKAVKIHSYLKKHYMVSIDGREYKLRELIMRTFYGMAPYPIIYKVSDPKYCVFDNLKYDVYISDEDEDIIYLNNIDFPFKRINGSSYDYISQSGLLYSKRQNNLKRINHANDGYCRFQIVSCEYPRNALAHRLVYETWVKKIDHKMTIDHLDTHKWNNWVWNLEEVTSSVNNTRACQKGLKKTTRWTPEQVHIICKMMEIGYSREKICEVFNISDKNDMRYVGKCMDKLRRGDNHVDIASNYDFSKYNARSKNHYSTYEHWKRPIAESLLSETNLSSTKIAKILEISTNSVDYFKRKMKE